MSIIFSYMFKTWGKIFIVLSLIISTFLIINLEVSAVNAFNRNLIFDDSDIYSLPSDFSSPQAIQSFLEATGSILATYQVPIGLYTGGTCAVVSGSNVCYYADPIANAGAFPGVPANLNPALNLAPYNGQTMSVANFIWNLSRTDFGSGCDYQYQVNICYSNSSKPVNPAFILSMIQKESRLVYGACSKPDADTNSACQPYSQPGSLNKLAFRMDRATGYFCFETPVKANSCWDESPDWLKYKGFFRQVYHMYRRVRLLEQMCIKGSNYSFKNSAGDFKVGSTVMIDGSPVVLQNGITCALYVYTPHFWGNNLQWLIMNDLDALYDFRDRFGIPSTEQNRRLYRL